MGTIRFRASEVVGNAARQHANGRSASHAPGHCRSMRRHESTLAHGVQAAFALVLTSLIVTAVPAGAQTSAVVVPPQTMTSCAEDIPVVVASDAAAQTDIYSATTLAGVLESDCVVLSGPRDGPFPAEQRARLQSASAVGYIVGGKAAVPSFKLEGRQFRRIGGVDRWATATAVGECAREIAAGRSCGELEFPSADEAVTLSLDGPHGGCGNRCPRVELKQGVYEVNLKWSGVNDILTVEIRTGAIDSGDSHGLGGCHLRFDTADKEKHGYERIVESGAQRLPDFDTAVCQGTVRAGISREEVVGGGVRVGGGATLTFTPINLREPVPDAPPAPPLWDWESRCSASGGGDVALDGWGSCHYAATWDSDAGITPFPCLHEWGSCEHILDEEAPAVNSDTNTYRVSAIVAGNQSCISPDAVWWNAGDCELAPVGLQVVIESLGDKICVWGDPYAERCPHGADKQPRTCWDQTHRLIVGRFKYADFDAAACPTPWDIRVSAGTRAKWTITFSQSE